MSKTINQIDKSQMDNQLFKKVTELIELARKKVTTTVNLTMVHTYFEIGKMIFDDEQLGKLRAEYGKTLIKDLSKQLTVKFGSGFSDRNLRNLRQFYLAYTD